MADGENFNEKIINEFRANGGKVGGPFQGAPVLLLHHTGAKSGTERVNPLMYQQVGDSYAIFASKGGAPSNPDWYYNLAAHPDTTIEMGTDMIQPGTPVAKLVSAETTRTCTRLEQQATMRLFKGAIVILAFS